MAKRLKDLSRKLKFKLLEKIDYIKRYLILNFTPNRLSKKYKEKDVREIILGHSDNYSYFFGYHDRKPFSKDSKILSHKDNGKFLDVGFFDLENPSKFYKVSSSNAFSTQQGSMLQWDNLFSDNVLNFNTMHGEKAYNVSHCTQTNKKIYELDMPIYCLSRDGSLALTCNFHSLAQNRPGYGIASKSGSDYMPDEDGIWLIDRNLNSSTLIKSINELVEDLNLSKEKEWYLNHLSFSPDAKVIIFFLITNSDNKKKIIFAGYRFGEKSSFLIEGDRLSSHYCWVNESEIFYTNRDHKLKWRYSLFSTSQTQKRDLDLEIFFDGHPMFCKNHKKLVIDTTPDSKRYQHLFF